MENKTLFDIEELSPQKKKRRKRKASSSKEKRKDSRKREPRSKERDRRISITAGGRLKKEWKLGVPITEDKALKEVVFLWNQSLKCYPEVLLDTFDKHFSSSAKASIRDKLDEVFIGTGLLVFDGWVFGYPLCDTELQISGLWLKHRDSFKEEPIVLGNGGIMVAGNVKAKKVTVAQDIWSMLDAWLRNKEALHICPVPCQLDWEKKLSSFLEALSKQTDFSLTDVCGDSTFKKRLQIALRRFFSSPSV